MGKISMKTLGFYMERKGDGWHEDSMFTMGEMPVKCIFGIQYFRLV
jgi:hypothetical protein